MQKYSTTISLSKNSRGVTSIDPSIGCSSGIKLNKKGCYGDCYAARIARIYGYDFSNTVYRDFTTTAHLYKTRDEIRKIKLPFVRMGTMGDPSDNWGHTIKICELIQKEPQLYLFANNVKEIVIITKHWNNLTNSQLDRIKKLKICINTSISVLDNKQVLKNSLKQYERLKNYCKSILRLVSADFNIKNKTGIELDKKQAKIFKTYNVLDTILRVSPKNKYCLDGIINIEYSKFLGKKCHISRHNKKTFFGECNKCIEKCGINM